jgi:hypothetical protein
MDRWLCQEPRALSAFMPGGRGVYQ